MPDLFCANKFRWSIVIGSTFTKFSQHVNLFPGWDCTLSFYFYMYMYTQRGVVNTVAFWILRFMDNTQLIQRGEVYSQENARRMYSYTGFTRVYTMGNFNLFRGFITTLRFCRRTWHSSGNMVCDITNICTAWKQQIKLQFAIRIFLENITQDLSFSRFIFYMPSYFIYNFSMLSIYNI